MGPKSNMAPGASGSIGRTSASMLRKAETLEGFVQGVTRPDIILSQISQIRAWPNVLNSNPAAAMHKVLDVVRSSL